MKTVVWFGNSGSRHGDFGLSNLRFVAPALAAVSARVPLRLRVVSNDQARFSAVTADYPFPCEFRTWRRDSALKDIASADLCIVPNSRDVFSFAKSANRLVLALSLGVPVVATSTPSAEPLRPFVIFDDWEAGLSTYLLDDARARADVAAAQHLIQSRYAPDQIARRWMTLLSEESSPISSPSPGPLVFIETPEDIGAVFLLQEIMDEALAVGSTTAFLASRPELIVQFKAAAFALRLFDDRDVRRGKASLAGVSALMVWEGASPGRRRSAALARLAQQSGVPVISASRILAARAEAIL